MTHSSKQLLVIFIIWLVMPFVVINIYISIVQVAKLPCDYDVPIFTLPRAEYHFRNLFSLNGMAVTMACNHLLK